MKRIFLNWYYWEDENLIGKCIRNSTGKITHIYIHNDADKPWRYIIYLHQYGKFFRRIS